MPTYEYLCRECGTRLEVVQSFSDDSLTVCDDCGGELRKVFSAAGLIFKGSGWHIKDYSGSSGAPAGAKGISDSKDSSESKDTKSDTGAKGDAGAKGGDKKAPSAAPAASDTSSSSSPSDPSSSSGSKSGSPGSKSSSSGSKSSSD